MGAVRRLICLVLGHDWEWRTYAKDGSVFLLCRVCHQFAATPKGGA